MTINTPHVVSLKDYRSRPGHAVIEAVESYWNEVRENRLMPSRSEIDPRGIASCLENAFVLERVAVGIARFRLAGIHLTELMGMEIRGMPLSAMVAPDSRAAVGSALQAVFDEPATVRMWLSSETGIGRPPLTAHLLLLPLRSDLGDVTRILGCLVAEGRIGRAPRRFAVTREERRTLVGYADAAPAPAVSATVAPETPSAPRPRAPHLTLVKSD